MNSLADELTQNLINKIPSIDKPQVVYYTKLIASALNEGRYEIRRSSIILYEGNSIIYAEFVTNPLEDLKFLLDYLDRRYLTKVRPISNNFFGLKFLIQNDALFGYYKNKLREVTLSLDTRVLDTLKVV